MKNNITRFPDCYGCGVCVKACPLHIISLKENQEGFYQPYIKEMDKCIECGRCLKTCAFNHGNVEQTPFEIRTLCAWSDNDKIRLRCSSGGIGFEIGRQLINTGYKGVGVCYNTTTNRAEHFIAHTVEEFMPSVGSKYIPADMTRALAEIDPKKKYLVTGTPCQIDSFRRYIRMMKNEDNFVLLDFFCHGVPSLLLWDKYIDELCAKIGHITFTSWRNKMTGWHDSWAIQADVDIQRVDWKESYNLNNPEKKHFYVSRKSQGDLFYKFFLGNYCLNKCCYTTCKYKMSSSAADIRIGDAWGSAYKDDTKGVSVVLVLTQKGQDVIDLLHDRITFEGKSFAEATEGQMIHNAYCPPIRDQVVADLKSDLSLIQINNHLIKPYRRSFLPARIANKVLHMLQLKTVFTTR